MKKFCHDKVMSVTTLKDKVSGPNKNKLNTDKQGHDRLFHVPTKIPTQ